jgi:hypothetical protein
MHQRHICDACLESEYKTYAHARVHEWMANNKIWLERFAINSYPRWDYDPSADQLKFSQDGRLRVVADVVTIGGVDNQGTQWEWTWGNPNHPDSSRIPMQAVREFGMEKEWARLTTLFLENDEYLGWELSSIAAHILGAEGIYRCPDSNEPGNFTYLAVMSTHFSD